MAFKLLSEDAKAPIRATQRSAAWDLFATEDIVIPSGVKLDNIDNTISELHVPIITGATPVKTGISVLLKPGTYGRIAGRSGLALRNGICVAGGVIDFDYYPNEIMVLLYNVSSSDYKISKGDRIAQLIIEKYDDSDMTIIPFDSNSTDELTGAHQGFGSTGK